MSVIDLTTADHDDVQVTNTTAPNLFDHVDLTVTTSDSEDDVDPPGHPPDHSIRAGSQRLVPVRRRTHDATEARLLRRSRRRSKTLTRLHADLSTLRYEAAQEQRHFQGVFAVQPSPIHGQGLFAVGRVRRGTELRYIGVTFPSLSTIRKYYEERNPPPYVMATGTPADYYIDAGDVPCLSWTEDVRE